MADLMEPKVFGIGFQKTGTKTLRKIYWELGYTVKSGGSYTPGKRRIWSITGAAIAALRGVPASKRQARGEDTNS